MYNLLLFTFTEKCQTHFSFPVYLKKIILTPKVLIYFQQNYIQDLNEITQSNFKLQKAWFTFQNYTCY